MVIIIIIIIIIFSLTVRTNERQYQRTLASPLKTSLSVILLLQGKGAIVLVHAQKVYGGEEVQFHR